MELTDIQQQIADSVTNGFVDRKVSGNEDLMPHFIYNGKGDSMWQHIERELSHCSSYTFVIAFITERALAMLKTKIADAANDGVHGRILTSNYLMFNDPKVFSELEKLPNVEVRIAQSDAFHAKGYLFNHDQDNYQSAIVGSANLTQGALLENYEWNIEFTSHDNGAIMKRMVAEVETAWHQAKPLTNSWIAEYRKEYDQGPKMVRAQSLTTTQLISENQPEIIPNSMQASALHGLTKLRLQGERRGLVVSATGTGKTYLGAFDVKNFQPKRFLYIIHREQILNKTLESFKTVLQHDFFVKHQEEYEDATQAKFDAQFGVISGDRKDYSAKYLFATIQTISKDEQLKHFSPSAFDYILIDEAHRAGAASYQRVVQYFQPQFLLGMTATPERMDDFNIFEMFDYNVPYEIRLQKALEAKMLCPFNYIGITDYERDGQITDDTSKLQWLVSEERVDYVIQQTNYYGYSGKVLRGLVFCSRTDEAVDLAREFTKRGYPSEALTGGTPQVEREAIVKRLEQGDLVYIITVDVFNEGVDIPCVNQIVMLRDTQSSIVFIQQLGRGLRKFSGKNYVTVIDFIGNYKNNYLIPIALTGDKSRNKNIAHDKLDVQQISGFSTISFSKIAKERIYESINRASLSGLRVLRQDYLDLKYKLGRMPLLSDFQKAGTVDCMVFADRFKNYYDFLIKMKENVHLTLLQEKLLNFVSLELMNGKRVVELKLLQRLLEHHGTYAKAKFVSMIKANNIFYNETVERSVERVFSLAFFATKNKQVQKVQESYGGKPIVILLNGNYQLSETFEQQLSDNPFFSELIKDALTAGFMRSNQYQTDRQFTLYQRYTRKDVCRLLGWDVDTSTTLFGYQVRQGICPVFVTYKKSDEIDDSIKYADRFINANVFQWYTRHNVKLDSEPVQQILNGSTTMQLFVKRNDDDGKEFYYFGEVTPEAPQQETVEVKGKREPIVKMYLKLKHRARFDMYTKFEK